MNHAFRGYDFLGAHPCLKMQGRLVLGARKGTEAVDTLLVKHLEIPEESIPDPKFDADMGEAELARALVERALVLYGEVVRICSFPCFDRGRVFQIELVDKASGTYRAAVALPVVDNFPDAILRDIFRVCLNTLSRAIDQAPTPEAVAELYEELDNGPIGRLLKERPLGTSIMHVCQLAFRSDIPFRHLGRGLLQLGIGVRARLFSRGSSALDSAVGAQVAQDKHSTARLLSAAGLPVAEHVLARSLDRAVSAAEELGWPVVVKPANRDRSVGVTTGIRSEEALRTAYSLASSLSSEVLVERHVPGECHRILVVNGKVIYGVKRLPKGIVGNGRDSVTDLVDAANRERMGHPPWKRLMVFPLDDLATDVLAEQGLTPESVPEEGRRVCLRTIVSTEWGGDMEELTARIDPENGQLAIEAARILGLAVAGVDIMSTDIGQPWHANGAVINEVNYAPQFSTVGREEQMSKLMPELLEGDGRIPVHLVTGEKDLLKKAHTLKRALKRQGRKCHLTSAGHTEDDEGAEIRLAHSTLFERSLALTLRPEVEEFIMVGEMAELFEHGLAVDRLETIVVADHNRARAEGTIRMLRGRFQARNFRIVGP